jgi:hypothetical protein
MITKQSQPAARRRGELHRAHGDRRVAQAMGARRAAMTKDMRRQSGR